MVTVMNNTINAQIYSQFSSFISLWKTKETKDLSSIFSKHVYFTTSTSKTMPDGSQHSLFGLKDFLDDFPSTNGLEYEICNWVCTQNKESVHTYADVVCKAYNNDHDFFSFTAMILTVWKKEENIYKCVDIKQEIAPGTGNLKAYFEKNWNLSLDMERIHIIQGEFDSPWNNGTSLAQTEQEAVLECLFQYFYGLEHATFQYAYQSLSQNLNAYSSQSLGEEKRALLGKVKARRLKTLYEPHPLKISSVQVDCSHAYVYADQILTNLPEYLDPNRSWSKSKETIELEKEEDGWKIVYMHSLPGIFEISS
jgi:hypothetical protein